MATDDFFRARLDQMIDLRHPLVVLAGRLPWGQIEAALALAFARKDRLGQGQRPVRDDVGDCGRRRQCSRPATPADPADGIAALPQARLQPER